MEQHSEDPNILVGLDTLDDAGIYRITDELALVQTLDFITPVVDDPYVFGQIAAANSISDIYAMGGTPITAMNIICFATCNLPMDYLGKILKGGLSIIKEANLSLIGGHSVDDLETKYGLSVNGLVHPAKIKRNNTIKPGDRLILTKPLGSGILSTGIKMDKIKPTTMERCIHIMRSLNKTASEVMQNFDVSACTDVTGFGLIGHLSEMLQWDITRFPSNPPSTELKQVEKGKLPDKDILLFFNSIPIQDEVMDLIQQKYIPGGTYNNFDFFSPLMKPKESISEDELYTLVDPQTSGGLIISVNADLAKSVLNELHHKGVEDAAIIGQVEQGSGFIHIC